MLTDQDVLSSAKQKQARAVGRRAKYHTQRKWLCRIQAARSIHPGSARQARQAELMVKEEPN